MINLNPLHYIQNAFHPAEHAVQAIGHDVAQVVPHAAQQAIHNPVVQSVAAPVVAPVVRTVQNAQHFLQTPSPDSPVAFSGGGIGGDIRRAIVGAGEAINPFDAESKGNNLINQANQQLHFTPQFKGLLDKANPVVYGHDLYSGILNNGQAIGLTQIQRPGLQHHIDITKTPGAVDTLVHEGLNTAWEHMNPQQQKQFLQLAQKSLPASGQTPPPKGWSYGSVGNGHFGWRDPGGVPGILPGNPRDYLKTQYDSYKGVSPTSLDNLTNAPPVVQREILPYLADYSIQNKQPLPAPLQKYYSQFYGAKQPAPNNSILSRLSNAYRSL